MVIVTVGKAVHRIDLFSDDGGYIYRCDCGWTSLNGQGYSGDHREAARVHMQERPLVIVADLSPTVERYGMKLRSSALSRLPAPSRGRRTY